MYNKEVTLYKPVEDQKTGVTREEFEQLLKRVDAVEQENKELKQIISIFTKQVSTLREKIEVIGLIHHWFHSSSMESQYYDQEIIQELSKKYHLNQNELEPIEEIKRNRIEEIQNYLLQNPDRYLTGQEIVEKYHIDIRTARRDMKEVVQRDPMNYKEIRVTTLRKHKNNKKQKRWVNAITHIVSRE